MKLCKDCKWYHDEFRDVDFNKYLRVCRVPKLPNPIDGSHRFSINFLPEYRDNGDCGYEALFFTPKDETK